MPYAIEVTDTFGGEANYCWVKRGEFTAHSYEFTNRRRFRRQLAREVREVAGWPTSIRIDIQSLGDMYEVRPRGLLQVAFVTYQDSADD